MGLSRLSCPLYCLPPSLSLSLPLSLWWVKGAGHYRLCSRSSRVESCLLTQSALGCAGPKVTFSGANEWRQEWKMKWAGSILHPPSSEACVCVLSTVLFFKPTIACYGVIAVKWHVDLLNQLVLFGSKDGWEIEWVGYPLGCTLQNSYVYPPSVPSLISTDCFSLPLTPRCLPTETLPIYLNHTDHIIHPSCIMLNAKMFVLFYWAIYFIFYIVLVIALSKEPENKPFCWTVCVPCLSCTYDKYNLKHCAWLGPLGKQDVQHCSPLCSAWGLLQYPAWV